VSVFDADAEEAALAPPELVIGGRTYRGRVLSRDELRPHAVVLGDKDATAEDKEAAAVALVRLVFRRPWWKFWWPDPVKRVLRMPLVVQTEFLEDFFGFLARMVTPRKPNPPTGGPSSSPSTVAPPSGTPRAGSAGA